MHLIVVSHCSISCLPDEEMDQRTSTEFIQQLGAIGLPHDINVQSLFDPTGTHAYAHTQFIFLSMLCWSLQKNRGNHLKVRNIH